MLPPPDITLTIKPFAALRASVSNATRFGASATPRRRMSRARSGAISLMATFGHGRPWTRPLQKVGNTKKNDPGLGGSGSLLSVVAGTRNCLDLLLYATLR